MRSIKDYAPKSLDELRVLANRMTYHRARAEAMGFRFDNIDVKEMGFGLLELRSKFICICGREEHFRSSFHADLPGYIATKKTDVAGELWRLGSFSREHLLKDGYTPEQCDQIEGKAKEFDGDCLRELQMRIDEDVFLRNRGPMMYLERGGA